MSVVDTIRLPVLDGHNDVVQRLSGRHGPPPNFFERNPDGHLDLPRAQEAEMVGGFFAVFVPDPEKEERPDIPAGEPYEFPLPPPLDYSYARSAADEEIEIIQRLIADSKGELRLVLDAAQMDACREDRKLGVILHLEGAEPIDPGLERLPQLYEAGMRSLGLVWSRPNAFATGVPFKFPSAPDLGPGLSHEGRELVAACNRLGIVIDLSHLNEAGFWDVAGMTSSPLVASHSNANALAAVSRNLTDKQLDAIDESEGLVGLNFSVSFLREDGNPNPDTPLETIARHAAYIAERIGVENVAFGSDFDGTTIPSAVGDVTGYPKVLGALREIGFVESELRQIAYLNWLRVLKATWH